MAMDWEEWILNNWIEPSEAAQGRIRELVEKGELGVYIIHGKSKGSFS
jgi:hypothetical protein